MAIFFHVNIWEAGMAQRWKRSPLTNVARVRFRHGAICGLSFVVGSLLAPRVFLRILRFLNFSVSPILLRLEKPTLQIPIQPGPD